jgi:hypothetical protein
VDIPRVLESLVSEAIQGGQLERALTLAGAAAVLRKRFDIRTMDSRQAELEQQVDTVRKQVGAEATTHWLKGWNMSAGEIFDWVSQEGEERWTTSYKP